MIRSCLHHSVQVRNTMGKQCSDKVVGLSRGVSIVWSHYRKATVLCRKIIRSFCLQGKLWPTMSLAYSAPHYACFTKLRANNEISAENIKSNIKLHCIGVNFARRNTAIDPSDIVNRVGPKTGRWCCSSETRKEGSQQMDNIIIR